MDFEKYLRSFSKISGVKAINIIHDINNPEIYSRKENDLVMEGAINNLIEALQEKVLNLSVNSFKLETLETIVLCIVESNSALLFVLEKETDLAELKPHIDEFLNDLLISM